MNKLKCIWLKHDSRILEIIKIKILQFSGIQRCAQYSFLEEFRKIIVEKYMKYETDRLFQTKEGCQVLVTRPAWWFE